MKYAKRTLSWIFVLTATMLICGCYPTLRKEAGRPEEALLPVQSFYPHFGDDLELESLILAVQRNLDYLNRVNQSQLFQYGPHQFTCEQVRESQEVFLRILLENPSPELLNERIKKNFRVYRAAGRVGDNRTLFTGYFEPTYEASLVPDGRYKYPLYRKPDDLVRIDLSLFSNRFGGENLIARIDGKKVLPYYSRYQIDVEKALEGRHFEIAWLKDPVDVTFLHIQGSGRLLLPDGRSISVGYQASNGRPYRSIGRFMLEKGLLRKEEVSMQTIRSYLLDHPERKNEILNHNPSYIFFQVLADGPLGNINVPLTPGRSLALDDRLFPKGALGFIICQKPLINANGQIAEWKKFSRLVVVQDTGGAIKGAGRADLFWGSGRYAELAAGNLRHNGELYLLIKKFNEPLHGF